MDTLHQRLKNAFQVLLDLGVLHTQKEFSEAIGKTKSQISDAFNNRPRYCTLGLMKAIASAFPDDLNSDYLLTGEGPVINPRRDGAPHYSTLAAAGSLLGLSDHDTDATTLFFPINPHMASYDFTVTASGRSMEPEIQDGDTLYCRRITDRHNSPLAVGNIYVFCTREGTVVKELASINEETLTLHSLNPAYSDTHLHCDSLLSTSLVIGILHPLPIHPYLPE